MDAAAAAANRKQLLKTTQFDLSASSVHHWDFSEELKTSLKYFAICIRHGDFLT